MDLKWLWTDHTVRVSHVIDERMGEKRCYKLWAPVFASLEDFKTKVTQLLTDRGYIRDPVIYSIDMMRHPNDWNGRISNKMDWTRIESSTRLFTLLVRYTGDLIDVSGIGRLPLSRGGVHMRPVDTDELANSSEATDSMSESESMGLQFQTILRLHERVRSLEHHLF